MKRSITAAAGEREQGVTSNRVFSQSPFLPNLRSSLGRGARCPSAKQRALRPADRPEAKKILVLSLP